MVIGGIFNQKNEEKKGDWGEGGRREGGEKEGEGLGGKNLTGLGVESEKINIRHKELNLRLLPDNDEQLNKEEGEHSLQFFLGRREETLKKGRKKEGVKRGKGRRKAKGRREGTILEWSLMGKGEVFYQ